MTNDGCHCRHRRRRHRCRHCCRRCRYHCADAAHLVIALKLFGTLHSQNIYEYPCRNFIHDYFLNDGRFDWTISHHRFMPICYFKPNRNNESKYSSVKIFLFDFIFLYNERLLVFISRKYFLSRFETIQKRVFLSSWLDDVYIHAKKKYFVSLRRINETFQIFSWFFLNKLRSTNQLLTIRHVYVYILFQMTPSL